MSGNAATPSAGTSGANGSAGQSGASGAAGNAGFAGSGGTGGVGGGGSNAGSSGQNGSAGDSSGASGHAGAGATAGTTGTAGTGGTGGTGGSTGTSGTAGVGGIGGTAGTGGASGSLPIADVVLNEVTSTNPDRIEIVNRGTLPQDMSGWWVIDSDSANTPYVFASGTMLAPGDRIVLVGEGVDFGFGLKGPSPGDAVWLKDSADFVVDSVFWGPDAAAVSYCRYPDGVGSFQTCSATFGAPNALP